MRDTLRQDLVVGPGGIIEIHAPNLPAGSVAEVIVRLKKPIQPNQNPEMPIQRRKGSGLAAWLLRANFWFAS